MIVKTVAAPKNFTPFDLTITLENIDEKMALLRALEHYCDRHGHTGTREILVPIITALKAGG